MQQVVINGTSSDWCEIKNGAPQGSILGPFLFLININDLPLVCKNVEILLFADDTNIEAVGCSVENIKPVLDSINFWLESNKLVLNLSKTIQLDLKKVPANLSFQLNKTDIKVEPYCKYLGVKTDNKFSFRCPIDHMQNKLRKQCGILAKLRHYVPRNQLISYYNSNVTPLIQYGALVYGCRTYSALLPIDLFQKKILKVVYFRKEGDHCDDIFIYELHIYELIKFVLKSISGLTRNLSAIICFNLNRTTGKPEVGFLTC